MMVSSGAMEAASKARRESQAAQGIVIQPQATVIGSAHPVLVIHATMTIPGTSQRSCNAADRRLWNSNCLTLMASFVSAYLSLNEIAPLAEIDGGVEGVE